MLTRLVDPRPRSGSVFSCLFLLTSTMGACSASESGPEASAGGGLPNTTQVGGSSNGGVVGIGGAPHSSGGATVAATPTGQGGSTTVGGSGTAPPSVGGAALGTSSSLASGGAAGTFGSSSTGGAITKGGASAVGGKSAVGGTLAAGGKSIGGTAGEGGTSGGKTNAGGSSTLGGSAGTTAYAPCPTDGTACKILPFGDSITFGMQSTDAGGYRSQLFKLIVAGGQKVTFTGSQSDGPTTVSGMPFPKSHEGHSGWTIDPGFSSYGAGGISSLVPSPAFGTIPNVVLLMIGTNDVYASSGQNTMSNRLESLLDKIIQTAPNALIVLATPTPLSTTNAALTAYSTKIPAIVQARVAKGQHLSMVDMSRMPTSSLSDGVHPNDQGYAYMANVWYAAIKDLLPKS